MMITTKDFDNDYDGNDWIALYYEPRVCVCVCGVFVVSASHGHPSIEAR